MQQMEGVDPGDFRAFVSFGQLQIYMDCMDCILILVDESGKGGPTTQRLDPYATRSGKEIKEPSPLDIPTQYIEKRFFCAVCDWPGRIAWDGM